MVADRAAVLRFGWRLLLALLPALLMGAYARWPALAFIWYGALVPWVWLYTDDRQPRISLGYYAVGAYVSWMLLYPQTWRYGLVAPFAIAALMFIPTLAFGPLLRRIHHRFRLPRTLSVPLIWVAVEWIRATFTIAHFDLYRIGPSQGRFSWLIQIADIVGVYGISFLVAAVNGLTADVLFAIRDHGGSLRRAWRERRVALAAIAVAAAFGVSLAYGAFRATRVDGVDGPRLAIVQPNVLHTIRNAVGVHLSQVLLTQRAVDRGEADLIVWPENAILDNIHREGAYLEDLAWLAREKQAPLLLGALGEPEAKPGKTTNSAYVVDGEGKIGGEYVKVLLFPWGEYIPLDEVLGRTFPALQRAHRVLARKGWGFMATGTPGERMNLLSIPWRGEQLPFGVLICNENTYPPLPAEAGRQGARFFVNITSEGEVGGPVQEQLLRMCMLRAVENRIAYVRCGNTGISGFIDAAGRVRDVLRRGKRAIGVSGVLVDRVQLSPAGATLYARSRDAFAKACVLATLVLLVWSFLPRARRRGVAAAAIAVLLTLGLSGCLAIPQPGSDPAAAESAYERGKQLFRGPGADRAAALAAFAEACADPEYCSRAMSYTADCFRSLRQMEAAAEYFAEIGRRYPELAGKAGGYRAFFLEKSGYVEQALDEYRRSLEARPSARVGRWRGTLQLRIGDLPGALESFRGALALAPDDLRVRYLLGKTLRKLGRLEEAREVLDAVLAVKLDHGGAWVELGRVRQAAGDEDGAVRAFRRAIEVDPDEIEARFMLARRALRAQRLDEVEELLREIRRVEATLGRGPREDD